MYNHSADKIEGLRNFCYSQTYLRPVVSEQDFEQSGVVNGLVHRVSVPTLGRQNWKGAHPFLQQNVPPPSGSGYPDFECSVLGGQ